MERPQPELKKAARSAPFGQGDDVVQLFGAGFKKAADVTRGLPNALLVLDQGDADIAFARSPKPVAWRNRRPRPSRPAGFEKSTLPRVAKRLGIGAQANMEARGGGTSQPARPKDSTSTSRRRL